MRVLLAILIVIALAACQEPPDRSEVNYASPAAVSTPLDLDPTDRIEIGRWWTNGRELLRLDPDGAFRLYATTNRHHPPLERGRWSRQSYAVMWLEPYSLLPRERVRVALSRMNGEIALSVPDLLPFFAIEQPPAVLEDALFGIWRGPLGTLQLDPTMRYTFSPDPKPAAGAALAGHRGRWRLDNGLVQLTPDAMGMGPFTLTLITGDERLELSTPEGGFEHEAEPAGPAGATGLTAPGTPAAPASGGPPGQVDEPRAEGVTDSPASGRVSAGGH